jgi:hypothetical protein
MKKYITPLIIIKIIALWIAFITSQNNYKNIKQQNELLIEGLRHPKIVKQPVIKYEKVTVYKVTPSTTGEVETIKEVKETRIEEGGEIIEPTVIREVPRITEIKDNKKYTAMLQYIFGNTLSAGLCYEPVKNISMGITINDKSNLGLVGLLKF